MNHFYSRLSRGTGTMIALDYNTLAIDLNHRLSFDAGSNEIPLEV